MKILFFICLSFLSNYMIKAQKISYKKEFSLGINYHRGLLVPKNQYINYLIQDNISAMELKLAYHPSPEKNWVRQYAVNEIGLAYYQGNLGNADVLGNVQSLSPYVQFSIKTWKQFLLSTHIGFGLARMSKHFHPVKNYANKLIGSEYNAHINLGLRASYSLTHFDITSDLVFNHFSNGSSRHPNDGLNIITGAIGLNYNFGRRLKQINTPIPKLHLSDEFNIIWSNAWKQANEQDPHIYYVSILNLSYTKGLNSRQRIGLGIDLFYDESTDRGYWTKTPKTSFKYRVSQSVFIAHELVFNRVSFITHLGYYTLYQLKPNSSSFYNRIGLRYKATHHLLVNLSLKGHADQSDFIEMGIGYCFNKK